MTRYHIRVVLTALVICTPLPAQVTFLRTYGGELVDERAHSVRQADDGGYIVAGYAFRPIAGTYDIRLFKTDSFGDPLWTQNLGGTDDEEALSVELTGDHGYILAGYTGSFGAGGYDVWLVKTDSLGDTLWTRFFGGTEHDKGRSVQQTDDHGYIIVGYTGSFGAGTYDLWLIKTDSLGDTLWTRTYGGPNTDLGRSVQQTRDHGYIIAGVAGSFGADGDDAWLIKTDSLGDTLWTRTFGGTGNDEALSVVLTDDRGYVVAGRTQSFGAGGYDVWLIKTDSLGDTVWTRAFGGPYDDGARSLQQTSDDGFILACNTDLDGSGRSDYWLIKTDSLGDTLWTRTYGGSTADDYANSARQTRDGGYVMAGRTTPIGVPAYDDIMLVKTDTLGSVGIAETPGAEARTPSAGPTICRGLLRLDGGRLTGDRLELLDITGRSVLSRPLDRSATGALLLDLRHLSPGIYFVKGQGPGALGPSGPGITKVALER